MFPNGSQKRVTRPTISDEIELCSMISDARKIKIDKQQLLCPITKLQKALCANNDCTICFDRSFASSHRAQYWSSENTTLPRNVFKFSHTSFKFNCLCGHLFKIQLCNIESRNGWCPYCAHKDLCDNENCIMCFNNSFASVDESQFLDPDCLVDPRHIMKASGTLQQFICPMCNHTFQFSPAFISAGRWCPYCVMPPKLICFKPDCQHCFKNSFASHEKSKYWSAKNPQKPRNILLTGSRDKYIFDCVCNHEIVISLDSILIDCWCSYCGNHDLCSSLECQLCFSKSFASYEKSIYWSPKNLVSPRSVFKSAPKKYIFVCPFCSNDYVAKLNDISNGGWCKCRTNKTETKLFAFLQKHCASVVEKQKKFDWCVNLKHLPFDFCIEEFKLIIELDGRQHFSQVSNWDSPEETQRKDKNKMKLAITNGYSVIRILQEEVWKDKNNWQQKLLPVIKSYSTPTIILLADIYSTFNYNDVN